MEASRATLAALGLWLLATLAVAYVFLGGVASGVQALLHLMVAGAAAIALALPDRKLESAGVARRWAFSAALLLAALSVGVAPVPRVIAAWVAPGLLMDGSDAPYLTLATDPSRVPVEMSALALVLGFGALVIVWGAARHRRNEAEAAIVLATGAVAMSAGLHAWMGAQTMLGLISPESKLDSGAFFAPFVNPNHAAAVMVLGGPVAVGVLIDPEHGWARRTIAGLVGFLALLVLAWSGSGGAVLAVGTVTFVWLLRSRGLPLWALGMVVAVAVAAQVWVSASWGFSTGSAGARAVLWRDALRMLGDFWLAGTGGGTFGEAIRPYRSDHAFLAFAHAHNDPLEWLVETGAIGVVAAVLGIVTVMWGTSFPRRADGLVFGLLALVLHSLVEFPLQMPAIAMSAAGLAALLLGVFAPAHQMRPRSVRTVILVVGLLQLPAAGWQAREAVVGMALADVHGFAADPASAALGVRALAVAGAGGPTRLLFDAWEAERVHDSGAAVAAATAVGERYPGDPDAVRDAAIVLARAKDYPKATVLLERAILRDPSDYRAWVILARIARAQGDPLLAQQRWSEAFHRDAPMSLLAEGYSSLPSGLVWLQSFIDVPSTYSVHLAFLLSGIDKPDEALLALEQAATLDPLVYGELLMRVPLLVDVGRPDEAERWILDVLSRRPEDVAVLEVQGDMFVSMGRHADATTAYLHAARLNPALRAKALGSAEREGGPERALDVARAFELEGTVDPVLRLQIAGVRMRAGDYVGCGQEIERGNLTTSTVGPMAMELLETCVKLSRTGGG